MKAHITFWGPVSMTCFSKSLERLLSGTGYCINESDGALVALLDLADGAPGFSPINACRADIGQVGTWA